MRKTRICYPNAFYHIYNQGVNRLEIFRDDEDNEYWIELLREATEKYNLYTYCFVTMQNHFHCLVETVEPNISSLLWHLGYYYARYINRKYSRVGYLFRNRCKSQIIMDLKYLRTVVWYIHNNPVASGIIQDVNEIHSQVYTSYHSLMGLSNKYSWLSKKRLFEKLDMINIDKKNYNRIWSDIDKQDFSEFTKIEISKQKLAGMF